MFVPMGMGESNWPATVGLLTGVFAKEVMVVTLDTLYAPPEVIQRAQSNHPIIYLTWQRQLGLHLIHF